jgi:hypothetical protein
MAGSDAAGYDAEREVAVAGVRARVVFANVLTGIEEGRKKV